MKLSLLLPTVGRPTLLRTLESLQVQAWLPDDEVMVLSDDNHEEVARLLSDNGIHQKMPVNHIRVEGGPHKDWGHTPRNRYMKHAKGDFLCHFDDDDVATPNMVRDIRDKLLDAWPSPCMHMVRMIAHKSKRIVWTQRGRLQRRHVSTQNVIHPNNPKTFGNWGKFYGGDSQFIIQTARNYTGRIRWHDVITCVYNPPAHLSYQEVVDWFSQLK